MKKEHSKIQLIHPEGKELPKIETYKYELMKTAILESLKEGSHTHKELAKKVNDYLKINDIAFDGSVNWYMECVKLHLEAINVVIRYKEKTKLNFGLLRENN